MENMVTKTEAAKLAGVSIKTIDRWISQGRIKAYRLGPRLVRIEEKSLFEVWERILPSIDEAK
jgi:excisionase family DNA binding protein